ncbi:MAG: KpsF/GutQ family sugar-phosphate isomerase [Saprospiraceae bacterium]|nr:KpsF/GutQ family sugar-phosphate isomerase [Saprospiraceae bacterium]
MISEEQILKTASRTIEIEMQALNALQKALNGDFVACAKAIFASKGRVVITGIGKSAIIAQKIVATLNSTGTPAIFMHAADAIHGDLGMIQPADLVLCLSKSGETPEIKVLAPLLKNMGNLLIGMVANANSFLGRQADFVLLTPIVQEADPNNLAPTASTTAQIAMGDALATALLQMRGFTSEHFAKFHPGGALGKQLYLRVSDIYIHNERPAIKPEAGIRDTILEMTSKRLGAVVVVDETEAILGIVTDGDLRRMLQREASVSHLKAGEIMSRNPRSIQKDALAIEALDLMRNNSISQLIVAENGQYLGIIHLHDLVREGLL